MIDSFYEKVKKDDLIGYLFNDIAKVDWEAHLPVMYRFWEHTVLGTAEYSGNAMTPHYQLHAKEPLKEEHFVRWLELFTATIDAHYTGEKAEEMKTRARNIAALMEHKILHPGGLHIG
ncbi:MAG: group III truncated hemoglobin [Chitinophagales bacterium]